MFRHLILTLLTALLFCSNAIAQEKKPIFVSVFKDHERYLVASNVYKLSWNIFEHAANDAGYSLVTEESSWRGSLQRLKAHKVDLVFAALKSKEREEWAEFTLSLVTGGSGIFTRLDNPANSLEDIDKANSIVGVSSKSLQAQMTLEVGFENIYSSVRRPQLYKMLKEGRIDYIFFGKSVIEYYCVFIDESKSKGCMKQVGPNFKPNQIHAIAAKTNSEMVNVVNDINQSLLKVSKSKTIEQMFTEYGFTKEHYQKWLAIIHP